MLNQPSGTRGYEIESENETYENTRGQIKFKKIDFKTWESDEYKIELVKMHHDGFGFTQIYRLSLKENGQELGDFYRLKNAKKDASEHKYL